MHPHQFNYMLKISLWLYTDKVPFIFFTLLLYKVRSYKQEALIVTNISQTSHPHIQIYGSLNYCCSQYKLINRLCLIAGAGIFQLFEAAVRAESPEQALTI